MNILVIDGDKYNRRAAEFSLSPFHDVVIAGNFDSAMDTLVGEHPSMFKDSEKREAVRKIDYDVVLTDLVCVKSNPKEREQRLETCDCGSSHSEDQKEYPFGFAIALTAVLQEVKYVGIVCGGRSISHYMTLPSAIFNFFNYPTIQIPKRLKVNNTTMLFLSEKHAGDQSLWLREDGLTHESPYEYLDREWLRKGWDSETFPPGGITHRFERARIMQEGGYVLTGPDYGHPIPPKNWARVLELLLFDEDTPLHRTPC